MNEKLNSLVERLRTDINGMPWADNGMSNQQLQQSVGYFIEQFVNDAKNVIEAENNG